jgi:hypothetical protein
VPERMTLRQPFGTYSTQSLADLAIDDWGLHKVVTQASAKLPRWPQRIISSAGQTALVEICAAFFPAVTGPKTGPRTQARGRIKEGVTSERFFASIQYRRRRIGILNRENLCLRQRAIGDFTPTNAAFYLALTCNRLQIGRGPRFLAAGSSS